MLKATYEADVINME